MQTTIFSAMTHLDAAIVPLTEAAIIEADELAAAGREVPGLARECRAVSLAILRDRLRVSALELGIIDGIDRSEPEA